MKTEVMIRLSKGLLRAIKASAKNNGRSVNSEIVRHLREMVKPDTDTKFEPGMQVSFMYGQVRKYGEIIYEIGAAGDWVVDVDSRRFQVEDEKLRIED